MPRTLSSTEVIKSVVDEMTSFEEYLEATKKNHVEAGRELVMTEETDDAGNVTKVTCTYADNSSVPKRTF